MRKVIYDIEGTSFISYKEAMSYKAELEQATGNTATICTRLEEITDTDTETKDKHRAKVEAKLRERFS